jgi:hypothetical protein
MLDTFGTVAGQILGFFFCYARLYMIISLMAVFF